MAFPVGTIVKKIGGQQKYKVTEEAPNDKSICILEPPINPAKFTFKNSDLEEV